MQQFASDNNAGMCPEALAALVEANAAGHTMGYGDDRWTAKACNLIRELFETDCDVFFVFSGTGANALALAHLCRSYNAVIAHASSHAAEDETGAPEFFSGGAKLLGCDTPLGKITPEAIAEHCGIMGRIHTSRPKVVSITQSTEMGTIYRQSEIEAIGALARTQGLKLHMDGARFANAIATLNAKPADLTWRAGVDVMSLGGVKNGLGLGEAVVFFDKALGEEFPWRVKQGGQLNSKMRFATAPWVALLQNKVWLKNARHANAMAKRLQAAIDGVPGVKIMFPVEANAVFAEIEPAVQAALRAKGWSFYTFLGKTGCRLMCAWDTQATTVDRFASDLMTAARTQA